MLAKLEGRFISDLLNTHNASCSVQLSHLGIHKFTKGTFGLVTIKVVELLKLKYLELNMRSKATDVWTVKREVVLN